MTAATVEGAVIFSDLVGFTEYNGVRGDVAAVAVLDQHRALMDDALAGLDGRVVKELGDGLLVWSPTAAFGLRIATGFLDGLLGAREAASSHSPLGSGCTTVLCSREVTTSWGRR